LARKKFPVIIALFIISVVVYALALFQSINDYENWKEAKLEEYRPELRPLIDFSPYISTRQGGLMVVLGTLIFLGFPIVLLFSSVKYQFSGDEEC